MSLITFLTFLNMKDLIVAKRTHALMEALAILPKFPTYAPVCQDTVVTAVNSVRRPCPKGIVGETLCCWIQSEDFRETHV